MPSGGWRTLKPPLRIFMWPRQGDWSTWQVWRGGRRLRGPQSFFFQRVRRRERRVEIESLRTERGMATSTEGILEVAEDWYGDLFSRREEDQGAADRFVGGLREVLIEEQRKCLEAPLLLEELTAALGTLREGKSPGSDGLTDEFLRRFWDMVGRDLWEVLRESWGKGFSLRASGQG